MGILDRLRLKPRWKHADPAVRLQAVGELDDTTELATLAEHDPDAKVRTASAPKVVDTAVLGRVTRSDSDSDARNAAADRLLALALDVANPDAAAAARELSDARRLSKVAKSSVADAVRDIALAGLTEERALGGVARQAQVKSTALAAVTRLDSAAELLAAALNSQHAAAALAAFDRLVQQAEPGGDAEMLQTVAVRSKQKAVARRAKSMLRAIEEAEHARRVAEEERLNEQARLCTGVQGLTALTDPDRIATELANLSAAWDKLARTNTETSTDTEAQQRFREGVDAARRHMAERRSEIAAALEEKRRRDEVLASREALCRRLETDEGEILPEQLQSTEEEWAELAPVVGYEREAEQLAARFARAAKACRKRIERKAAIQESQSTLEALVEAAESFSTSKKNDAARRCEELAEQARRFAATLTDASPADAGLLERLAAVEKAVEAHRIAARKATAKAARDRTENLKRLVGRATQAVEKDTLLTLREGDQLLREVTNALENARKEGETSETRDLLASLQTSQKEIAPRVKELFELDKWRRFANAERQEEIITMAEAVVATLKAEEEAGTARDLAAAANTLRDLQAQWKEVADAPRHTAQQLWERFKASTDLIRSACEVHFDQVRQERSANLVAKTALVEEAEALADSTEWGKASARFREMQKAWQEIGPVPAKSARSLAPRFRAAANQFFNRRREDLKTKKVTWDANLTGKEALCERAEELAESTDWEAAAAAIKQLQVEWKDIGPVERAKSEKVWKRFRTAADKFFERYRNRHEVAAAAQLAEREVLVVELEGLVALDEAPEDLGAQVQELRTKLADTPSVRGDGAMALQERWTTALAALASRSPAAFAGTDLDVVKIRERLERLVTKVESLVVEEEAAVAETDTSTAEALAEQLRAALESNAMGIRPDEEKWRAAGKAVEEAQVAWRRLAWLPAETMGPLEEKFEAACSRVMDVVKQKVGATPGSRRP